MITLKFALRLALQNGSGCPNHGNQTAAADTTAAKASPDTPVNPLRRWLSQSRRRKGTKAVQMITVSFIAPPPLVRRPMPR